MTDQIDHHLLLAARHQNVVIWSIEDALSCHASIPFGFAPEGSNTGDER